jgi:5-methylcytosine-specific restriction endonuclease McrA
MAKKRLEDKKFRVNILKRDKYTCQMCKRKKSGRGLEVHHIIKWATGIFLRYDPLNCITLCKSCHFSIRNKESHYITFFQGIINGKK